MVELGYIKKRMGVGYVILKNYNCCLKLLTVMLNYIFLIRILKVGGEEALVYVSRKATIQCSS